MMTEKQLREYETAWVVAEILSEFGDKLFPKGGLELVLKMVKSHQKTVKELTNEIRRLQKMDG
jgi:hypothetical protein